MKRLTKKIDGRYDWINSGVMNEAWLKKIGKLEDLEDRVEMPIEEYVGKLEKDTPRKIEEAQDYEGKKIYICPICKTRLHDLTDKYCSNCGQALEEWI